VDLSGLDPHQKDDSGAVEAAGNIAAVADTGSSANDTMANDAMMRDTALAMDLALQPEAIADRTSVEAGQGTTPETDVDGQAADGSRPVNDAIPAGDLLGIDAAVDSVLSQDGIPLVDAAEVDSAPDVGAA